MSSSKHCDPATRENITNLQKAGRNSYRKISELLGISDAMVENAVKWIPKVKNHVLLPTHDKHDAKIWKII